MSNPKGPNISRLYQKVKGQADDSKNLSCETLYISDYEYVNIFTFALSDIKLWLTMVPELMKVFRLSSYLSDSKNQTIIYKVLFANDGGN